MQRRQASATDHAAFSLHSLHESTDNFLRRHIRPPHLSRTSFETTSIMPSQGAIANRRFLVLLMAAITFVSVISWAFSSPQSIDPPFTSTPTHIVSVSDDTLKGDAIMGKIGNETVKAELGRAAWRLFHTTMAKFPDKPTQDEQTALFSYIHLFARLYPW